jgi:anthranilate synthase/indole-3-glycerol phosphate synthase/phosphoribosylanthranilate isomerase
VTLLHKPILLQSAKFCSISKLSEVSVMPSLDLVDFSRHQTKPSPPLESASNLVLIDNYDSFTWNVYQYLVLEGANVTVFRNDKITLDELIAKKPTQVVISPGPGHPDTDSGVSKAVIAHFAGKIPVLGVCMGEQCMFSAFGGEVVFAGEILHGKTSLLRHDGKGVYAGLAQDLPVTRYHSLAGTHKSLPECLEVSSWSNTGGSEGKGVIMGVRHKEFVVEGVQFHPESILTAEGRPMLRNFLKMKGGTWKENAQLLQSSGPSSVLGKSVLAKGDVDPPKKSPKSGSILDQIFEDRKTKVAAQKEVPSQTPRDLQEQYDMGLSPSRISFPARVKQTPFPLALMAEIKRASPSKGVISEYTCAAAQARKYALAGASVISVLTEPRWFKGSIEDLKAVRQSLEGMPNRPAILRKEFVFDEYQILEARLAGADTVLLIVKMLDWSTLERLYTYSLSLGMEPLVEVNTAEEMALALKLGSKVIGVNNRNLTSFEVDLETTSRLRDLATKDVMICALSGISGPADVASYQQQGVNAILIGEALMRAPDISVFINRLFNIEARVSDSTPAPVLVKICGTRTAEAAKAAVDAGADLVGIILVEGRSRYVPPEVARKISQVVHSTPRPGLLTPAASKLALDVAANFAKDYFDHSVSNISGRERALVVGVFQNQPLEHILAMQKHLSLDVVQLHGEEPIEWARLIPVPVIRSFKPVDIELKTRGYHALPLLDSGAGGSGELLASTAVTQLLESDSNLKVILAGGLNPENVGSILKGLKQLRKNVAVVDVSSGVESAGNQDVEKIQKFIEAAKKA